MRAPHYPITPSEYIGRIASVLARFIATIAIEFFNLGLAASWCGSCNEISGTFDHRIRAERDGL